MEKSKNFISDTDFLISHIEMIAMKINVFGCKNGQWRPQEVLLRDKANAKEENLIEFSCNTGRNCAGTLQDSSPLSPWCSAIRLTHTSRNSINT